jgi:Tfp pilus assembly protein PilF
MAGIVAWDLIMPINRQEALEAMLLQDPDNTFARYGLAMEFVNTGNLMQAIREFEELVIRNPDYAAAYFHGGQTYEKLGRTDDARGMYLRGIDVTTRTGDGHTRSELEGALAALD